MKLRKQSLPITIILRKAFNFLLLVLQFLTLSSNYFFFILFHNLLVSMIHVYSNVDLKILKYCNTVCVIFLMQPFSLEFPGGSRLRVLDVIGLICFFKMI